MMAIVTASVGYISTIAIINAANQLNVQLLIEYTPML
jgi:hypothetical protein